MNININKEAPVIASNEILINSTVDKVFSVLTGINNWHIWQSSVTKSQINGKIAEGSKFKWKAGGISYNSIIHTCKNDAFGWTGTTIGAYAVHNWYLIENDGKTLVKVEESLEGLVINIMKKAMQKKLPEMMKKNLIELKSECEK